MDIFRRTFATRATKIAGVIFGLLVIIAIFANELLPASPYAQGTQLLAGPSWQHLLGTDDLGRDTLARLILGTQISFEGAIEAVLIGMFAGVIPGVLSVFLGKWPEFGVMRLVDAFMCFPPLVLAMGFVAILGEQQDVAMLGIGILFVPFFFRVTRAATLSYARLQYVEAATLFGATRRRVILTHVWRKVLPTVAVSGAQAMAGGLIAVSSIAFLGIGAQPPLPTWGGMLSEDLQYLSNAAWSAIPPGIAIVLAVASLGIIADGLRDATGINGPAIRVIGRRRKIKAETLGPVDVIDSVGSVVGQVAS